LDNLKVRWKHKDTEKVGMAENKSQNPFFRVATNTFKKCEIDKCYWLPSFFVSSVEISTSNFKCQLTSHRPSVREIRSRFAK